MPDPTFFFIEDLRVRVRVRVRVRWIGTTTPSVEPGQWPGLGAGARVRVTFRWIGTTTPSVDPILLHPFLGGEGYSRRKRATILV